MGDTLPRRHPIDVAGHDRLVGAKAVAVLDRAIE
jgi:hypothetical protein